jgi:hypothetical protein
VTSKLISAETSTSPLATNGMPAWTLPVSVDVSRSGADQAPAWSVVAQIAGIGLDEYTTTTSPSGSATAIGGVMSISAPKT